MYVCTYAGEARVHSAEVGLQGGGTLLCSTELMHCRWCCLQGWLLTTGVSGSSSAADNSMLLSSRKLGLGCSLAATPSPCLMVVSTSFLGLFFFLFFFRLPVPAEDAEIASGGAAEDMVSWHWTAPRARCVAKRMALGGKEPLYCSLKVAGVEVAGDCCPGLHTPGPMLG